MALGYRGAANRNGPSPIVWDLIPEAVITGTDPGLGWGFFDDFIAGPGHATTSTTLHPYIVTHVANTGTIVAGTTEQGDIVITTANAENDGVELQTGESFVIDKDCNVVFGAYVALLDADDVDFVLGLATHDTDVCGSFPNDNLMFYTADGSANIMTSIEASNSATTTDTTSDASDATAVKLECAIFGEGDVNFYVDGVEKIAGTAVTNIPKDVPLAATLGLQSGGTQASNTLTAYWWYTYQWMIN